MAACTAARRSQAPVDGSVAGGVYSGLRACMGVRRGQAMPAVAAWLVDEARPASSRHVPQRWRAVYKLSRGENHAFSDENRNPTATFRVNT